MRLPSALRDFAVKLKAWNESTFGNIFKRKKRNELRLGGVQRVLTNKGSSGCLLRLERELREERSLILLQEKLSWLQKSRIEWLRSGDGNTRFFHTSTLIRRRRNKIEALTDSEGRWVEGKESLKKLAVDFFSNLFKSDHQGPHEFICGEFPTMENEHNAAWCEEWMTNEIEKALREMGAWKAPGPNGYQPGFYKATWETTGQSVLKFVLDTLKDKEIPEEDAEATLVLIAKVMKPESITSFRPISFCNVCGNSNESHSERIKAADEEVGQT